MTGAPSKAASARAARAARRTRSPPRRYGATVAARSKPSAAASAPSAARHAAIPRPGGPARPGPGVLGGPVGVVRAGTGQQHRHVRRRDERPYQRAGLLGQRGHDDGPAAEAGLAQQLGDVFARLGAAQPVQARGAQRRGVCGQAVALALFPQVDGGGSGCQEGREPVGELLGRPVAGQRIRHRAHQAEQGRVRRVVIEEMTGQPVGHAQRTCQEGAFGLHDFQQAEGQEGRGRVQPGPGGGGLCGHPAEVEGETDGGPASAHVVVEVAVEGFEGPVDVGSEGDEHDGDVERGEARPPGQPGHPVHPVQLVRLVPGAVRRVRAAVPAGSGRNVWHRGQVPSTWRTASSDR